MLKNQVKHQALSMIILGSRRLSHRTLQVIGKFSKLQKPQSIKQCRYISTNESKPSFRFQSKFKVIAGLSLMGMIITLASSDIIQLDSNQKKENQSSEKEGVTVEDVQYHNSVERGVWVVINGYVYDLTEFLSAHPGGPDIIKKYAGKDASEIFKKYHARDIMDKMLPAKLHLGPLKGEMEVAPDITVVGNEELRLARVKNMPLLLKLYNISDFEYVAKKILPVNAWAYYSGAADDEITLRENHYAFGRIFFKPRVLVDVSDVDISTEMLGTKTDAPFYCSAAAQAKLGHEDGELGIARGCGSENLIQMISSAASFPLADIMDAAVEGQKQWFQLYVTEDRDEAFKTIKTCEERGIGGIFVTVDTPQLGRREKDLRIRFFQEDDEEEEEVNYLDNKRSDEDLGKKDPIYYKDASLSWKDIELFKKSTTVPIALKGVQRVEDVLSAIEHKVDAVVLSNHGGRQLDYSRAPIEVLADVMAVLKEKKLEDKIEIYVDGGVRRGTDVLKALCLGAKGVGLGRPFLYANSTYGDQGVARAIQLLKEEIILDMKLLGAKSIKELTPELLDMRSLHVKQAPRDMLYDAGYVPLSPPRFRDEPMEE